MSSLNLTGKTALITGAASGIGRATALLMTSRGARVTIVDVQAEALADTLALIEASGGQAQAITGDCGREADVAACVATAAGDDRRLDILFANAGISGGWTTLLEQGEELWAEVLRINLIGPFLAIKHAAPLMVEGGGGSIICTASVGGLRANAGASAYSASKAGVINLVQTAATALTGTNVRVNAVCPGLIETPMMADLFEKARARGKEQLIGQVNPLQRQGQPDEVAELVSFLASDAASYINGQAIAADGGLSSGHPFAGRPQR